MPDEKNVDVIEIAKRKRHAALLQKLKDKGSLGPAELRELQKFERKKEIPSTVVETQEHVARAFNVTPRTVSTWVRDGMPVRDDGMYDLIEVHAWKIAKSKQSTDQSDSKKTEYESNYRMYKSLLAEIDYKQKLAELMPREEVERGRVERIMVVKRALLGLPGRVSASLVGLDMKEIHEVLTMRLTEIVQEFAKGSSEEAGG